MTNVSSHLARDLHEINRYKKKGEKSPVCYLLDYSLAVFALFNQFISLDQGDTLTVKVFKHQTTDNESYVNA